MAGKRTNRQGFTLYHNLYENQLRYMSDDHVGKLIKAVFEYSIARGRGGKAEAPKICCFEGFEVGALRTATAMIDTSCDAYISRSVNSKLQKLNPDKKAWDNYRAYAPKDLFQLGFNKEEISFMKGAEPLEEDQPPLTPLNPGKGDEYEREHAREYEKEKESDSEPKLTRASLIAKLGQRGISLAEANRMINDEDVETVYRRYFGGV